MNVIVVSHTHWDREWHQPFEVFRLRLAAVVQQLLDILDGDPAFRHFMLDGQTICLDDVLDLQPQLRPRLQAHLDAGRISIGPWYVLQDEFLVGAESIVRNLACGLRNPYGRAMRVGYLPDAFGHIAQMPRILRGFGLDTAVVWRGVGDAPAQWRWLAPGGAGVLCLYLPGGYGNAHHLSEAKLDRSQSVQLWMNGNDHQPADPTVPATLASLAREFPDVTFEHASLERAAELAPEPVVTIDGELRKSTPNAPILSGTWSSRTWQKRDHDRAQSLLVRFVEPFVAFAGLDRREALAHAWRLLLQCQPHDSICGCSIDEVHREIDARLARLSELAGELLRQATDALLGAHTRDYPFHGAIAVLNPHPFAVSALVDVELQRPPAPFRVLGPDGEVPYQVLSRRAADGPALQPAEWLQLRLHLRHLPPLGVRTLALEPGTPAPFVPPPTTLSLHAIPGGLEIADGALRIVHTVEDEGDRGDLYDFCPTGDGVRSSRDAHLGVHLEARPIGRRVDIDVTIDNQHSDHRLRARFDGPSAPLWTETAFGWLLRTSGGTHPVNAIATAGGVALGGLGLHEIENRDGAILLTLLRAVGFMSRGDLTTRPGHAGYHIPTPEAQGLGVQRFRYSVAFGADAVRELDAGLIAPRALPLEQAAPADRPLLSLEPAAARLSIVKRSDDGAAFVVRLCGSPGETVHARLRWFRPLAQAWRSDLDERTGSALPVSGDELAVDIPANEVLTLRVL
jgi:alpha-mannosidase